MDVVVVVVNQGANGVVVNVVDRVGASEDAWARRFLES